MERRVVTLAELRKLSASRKLLTKTNPGLGSEDLFLTWFSCDCSKKIQNGVALADFPNSKSENSMSAIV